MFIRYFRFVAPALATTTLVLSLLCMFAGSRPGVLNSYDVLTVDTSDIEITSRNAFADRSGQDVNSLAHEAGLADFYSVYVLDFCSGNGAGEHRKVKTCSPATGPFGFSLASVLESHGDFNFGGGSDLAGLLDEAFAPLEACVRALFLVFCLGLVFNFLLFCVWVAFLAVPLKKMEIRRRRLVMRAVTLLTMMTFLCSLAASIILTVAADTAASVVAARASQFNVDVSTTGDLLALSWAATALALILLGFHIFEFISDRRRARKTPNRYSELFTYGYDPANSPHK